MKKAITEEDNVHQQWYVDAEKQTMKTLPEFLNNLLSNYHHDYETIYHAISAGMMATMNAMNNSEQGGITGFQAGCVMWEVIKKINYSDNKLGLRILDFDNLLYPQHSGDFEKVISKERWDRVRILAMEKIYQNKETDVHIDVWNHWHSITSGEVPFGFKVEGGNE